MSFASKRCSWRFQVALIGGPNGWTGPRRFGRRIASQDWDTDGDGKTIPSYLLEA
ncbi:MAG: hypothetical protein O3A21_04965 [Proteobacteria bacterium]|nr:hypothetical protein [Pseudomonadota bacterium]